MSTEIALDLRRYNSTEKFNSLTQDTASLSIEASTSGRPRINPHFYIKKGPDYVIAPGADKRDVRKMFKPGLPETEAANKIVDLTLNAEPNTAYVWISSPSEDWPEARLDLGVKTVTPSGRYEYTRCYCISWPTDNETCLVNGQSAAAASYEDAEFPIDVDKLRSQIYRIKIPKGVDAFEFLSHIIDVPADVWESIFQKEADSIKFEALRIAGKVTKTYKENPQVIHQNPVYAGAQIELEMKRRGFGMDPARFGCGISNLSVTTAISFFQKYLPESKVEFCPDCHTILVCGHCEKCDKIVIKM